MVVPLLIVLPVAVEAIWKLSWSALLTRVPRIWVWSRIVAKRIANITPCRPPDWVSTVTLVGLLLPRI